MLLQTAPIMAPEDPEVVVQLPRSWARAACTSAAVSVAERIEAEAALVTEDGSYAWTLQTGGCGQRGARLQLPRSWLLFNASSEAELEARTRRLGAEVRGEEAMGYTTCTSSPRPRPGMARMGG